MSILDFSERIRFIRINLNTSRRDRISVKVYTHTYVVAIPIKTILLMLLYVVGSKVELNLIHLTDWNSYCSGFTMILCFIFEIYTLIAYVECKVNDSQILLKRIWAIDWKSHVYNNIERCLNNKYLYFCISRKL